MTGPITISLAALVAIRTAPLGPRPEVLLDELDALLADEHVGVAEEIADVEVSGEDDLRAGEVFERAADGVVGRRQDDQRRAVETHRLQQLGGLARLGLVEDVVLDDADPFLDRLLAERASERESPHLLGHSLREVARPGAKDIAATLHARFSDAAVTCPSCSLLPVRLGAPP